MLVVSDTSPIRGLIAIGKIDILEKLFGKIIIPQAVEKELKKIHFLDKQIKTLLLTDWIEVRQCYNIELLKVLNNSLDKGESEAIALSKQINADLLLIDERLGRNFAKALNIKVIGLIGILVMAKQKSIIHSVKDVLDKLRNETGFWIKEDLYQEILISVNE